VYIKRQHVRKGEITITFHFSLLCNQAERNLFTIHFLLSVSCHKIVMSKVVFSYIFKTNLAVFRTAIIDDNTDKICRLLDIERELLTTSIDNDGNTALILAIHRGSPLTVRMLLEQGAQPDQPNSFTQQTPLGVIAAKAYEDFQSHKAQRTLEKAKILLEYGAYVDKPSVRVYQDEIQREYTAKETPLMIACRKGNLPLVKLFIEKNANVNYIERHSQIRPYVFVLKKSFRTKNALLLGFISQ